MPLAGCGTVPERKPASPADPTLVHWPIHARPRGPWEGENARHTGDDDSGAAGLDGLTELFEHHGHTDEVDVKDRVDVGLLG
jgi:hypothetical protein